MTRRRPAQRCRLPRIAAASVAAAMALAVAAVPALPGAVRAQSKDAVTSGGTQNTKFADWTLSCRRFATEPAARCLIRQNLVHRQTGKLIMNFTILRLQQRNNALMAAVTAPLGILLPAGLVLHIDDTEIVRIPLQFCNVNGCQGRFPMAADLRRKFESGSQGQLTFRQPNGTPLAVKFSLKGFTPAITALQAN